MAKINVKFNDTDYSINESALSSAATELRTHLSTVMNGSGATINFGGTTYNIDSTKLSTAKNNFVSHLGTVSGNGSKVVVGGVEYGVDSTKISGAVSALEAAFAGLNSGGSTSSTLEGDGAEFYTLAPSTLTFCSQEPLDEFQAVKVNGEVVDSSNYTLEEGSTIVKLSIDYLKTLPVGAYDIEVASANGAPSGGFTIKAPELNEHSFYYNQPYTAFVSMFGEDESFFIRDDGTMDIIGTPSGAVTQATYSVSGSAITVVSPVAGTLTGTISSDGTEIFCNELQVAFKLSNSTAIAADEDYIYIYKEDLGGYEVQAIDKTKAEYGAIKTGINGYPTVKLADEMFKDNTSLVTAPVIPDSVTTIGINAFYWCNQLTSITIPASVTEIGNAFVACAKLTSINFEGTVSGWNAITFKNFSWTNVPATYVQCSDGTVSLV